MFEAVFPFAALPAEQVIGLCLSALGDEGQGPFKLYRKAVKEKAMLREIQRRQHFDVEVSGVKLGWGGVRNHNLAFITASEIGDSANV